MTPVRTQESVWVRPNNIGNNFAENHCEIKIAAAINANDAPTPCKKLDSEYITRLSAKEIMIFPAANKKTPLLTTYRALNLSSKYPAGICIQANPRMKAPVARETPRLLV